MAQPFARNPGIDKVDDHIHPLLLDTQRRDFGEAERLDQLHFAFQRFVTAPIVDQDRATRFDFYRIAGKQIADDLDVGRIAKLHDRSANSDRCLAFLNHPQHRTAFRRADGQGAAACFAGGRRNQSRSRCAQFKPRGIHCTSGFCQSRSTAVARSTGRIMRGAGRKTAFVKGIDPAELGCCELAVGFGLTDSCRRGLHTGLQRLDLRAHFGLIAAVQEIGLGRHDPGYNGLSGNHRITGLQIDPLQLPANRRGDDIDITDAGFALVVDGNKQRDFDSLGDIDIQWRRAQREKDGNDDHRYHQTNQDSGSGPGQMFLGHQITPLFSIR